MQKLHSEDVSALSSSSTNTLSGKQKFLWGFFGGVLVSFFRLWIWINHLPTDAGCPHFGFRQILLCCVWICFPFISGLISRILEPNDRLHAVFEGASAPALFLLIAQSFPL